MDDFDTEILKLIQHDCRMSTELIGEQIGLSASACQRRIKKLRQQGIIKSEVAVLDATKLPNCITTIVEVTLEKGGEIALDDMIEALEKEGQVQQFYYMAGDVDFVVILVTPTMDQFDLLSRKLFMSNANIKKFTSKVVIKTQKSSLNIPLYSNTQ